MSERRVGPILSLLRQGFSLEREFGSHSLESLLRIAETVEESVYEAGSLSRTATGFRFALANPPLRVGAFGAIGLSLNGIAIDRSAVRFRGGPDDPWRQADGLDRAHPLLLAPGRRTEIEADVEPSRLLGTLSVRLELESVAIPPKVWFAFRDALREGDRPR